MVTSEFDPAAVKDDTDIDINDNVVKKRFLTNDVRIASTSRITKHHN